LQTWNANFTALAYPILFVLLMDAGVGAQTEQMTESLEDAFIFPQQYPMNIHRAVILASE